MARENFRKIKLLKLLEMLRQNTDEQHPLPTSSIIASLAQMEITCDRRTLAQDIATLSNLGYEIMTTTVGHEKAYYVEDANQGLNFPKSNGKHCERNAAKDMQEQALRRAHFGSGLNISQVTKPIEERFDGLPHRAYKCRHGIPSEQCVAALLLSGCPNLHAILFF